MPSCVGADDSADSRDMPPICSCLCAVQVCMEMSTEARVACGKGATCRVLSTVDAVGAPATLARKRARRYTYYSWGLFRSRELVEAANLREVRFLSLPLLSPCFAVMASWWLVLAANVLCRARQAVRLRPWSDRLHAQRSGVSPGVECASRQGGEGCQGTAESRSCRAQRGGHTTTWPGRG